MLERALGDDCRVRPRPPTESPFADARLECPGLLAIERGQLTSAREQRAPERVVPVSSEHVERALGPVEDATEQAGAELDLQRTPGVDDGLADPQAGGVLVDLDRDPFALEADDLARQRRLSDAHDVVQAHAVEARATTTGPATRQISPRAAGVVTASPPS